MDNNTVFILIFIVVIAVIFSFALGYLFACNRLSNKMINAEIKFVESKTKILNDTKARIIKEDEIPEELREIFNNIIEELEENHGE